MSKSAAQGMPGKVQKISASGISQSSMQRDNLLMIFALGLMQIARAVAMQAGITT